MGGESVGNKRDREPRDGLFSYTLVRVKQMVISGLLFE